MESGIVEGGKLFQDWGFHTWFVEISILFLSTNQIKAISGRDFSKIYCLIDVLLWIGAISDHGFNSTRVFLSTIDDNG